MSERTERASRRAVDRARLLVMRFVNLGYIDADKADLIQPHIRLALDMEVEAGGPFAVRTTPKKACKCTTVNADDCGPHNGITGMLGSCSCICHRTTPKETETSELVERLRKDAKILRMGVSWQKTADDMEEAARLLSARELEE